MENGKIMLSPVGIDELISAFEKCVDEKLPKCKCKQEVENEKNLDNDLITREKLSEILKVSLSTLYYWTKKGTLTSYKIEQRLYYKRSEIEQSLIEIRKPNVNNS
jgi:hypothetical protein